MEKEYKLFARLLGNGPTSINSILKEKNLIINRFRINYGDEEIASLIECIVKYDYQHYDQITYYTPYRSDEYPINNTSNKVIKDNFLDIPIKYNKLSPNYIKINRYTLLYDCDF
jgi:hypothetical protein